jgi:hypothetical protein
MNISEDKWFVFVWWQQWLGAQSTVHSSSVNTWLESCVAHSRLFQSPRALYYMSNWWKSGTSTCPRQFDVIHRGILETKQNIVTGSESVINRVSEHSLVLRVKQAVSQNYRGSEGQAGSVPELSRLWGSSRQCPRTIAALRVKQAVS